MSIINFKEAEKAILGQTFKCDDVLDSLLFNNSGLLPAIAQQFDTKDILMMAWMNREALEETLHTGRVCYYSRSRQKLWRKGESSGQVQTLKSLSIDCDGDSILLQVDQTGPACHTGRRSCFYLSFNGANFEINREPIISPDKLYNKQ